LSKIFSFQERLKYGKSQEAAFEKLFGDFVERLDGYVADFKIRGTNLLIELKNDTYDARKTKNFFMERYSYGEVEGGPWQALEKGVDYFIYCFPKNGLIYVFKTRTLVNLLNKICEEMKLHEIKNINHTTRGYVVPRVELDKIAMTMDELILAIKEAKK
jgi:hypothetical protein